MEKTRFEALDAAGKHAYRIAERPSSGERVRCPFYRTDDGGRSIVCEGFIDDSCVTLTYRFSHLFEKQLSIFCADRFENCEVYRMLMEKYE